MKRNEITDYLNETPSNTNPAILGQLFDEFEQEIKENGGSGVGQKGMGENAETFNSIAPEKATGKNSHIEGNQNYLKEYPAVTVSNVVPVEQTYEISVDINKDIFPHIMQFWQNGELKHAFITRGYNHDAGFVVTSYSDISALVGGVYDIKLVSGLAMGDRSHVEGNNNIANAREAHVEGWNNMATAWTDGNGKKIGDAVAAHVEGRECRAIGRTSHAEGRLTKAIGEHSHAEGLDTVASGKASHAEGEYTDASGDGSHAEGGNTTASGLYSHTEGYYAEASGAYSHAEGQRAIASGKASHTEGRHTDASGQASHAEGEYTDASGQASHAEGGNIDGYGEEGGRYEFDDGKQIFKTTAEGIVSHAEGNLTLAEGYASHTEGSKTRTTVKARCSHAEGLDTVASGQASHAEGLDTVASGKASHAEGEYTDASGQASHAEGYNTTASDFYSHAEGKYTDASGQASHAEGCDTTASDFYSHAEGLDTVASGAGSHAEGEYTVASGKDSHVQGEYNLIDTDTGLEDGVPNNKYAHIVGNGDYIKRSNAHTIDWQGNSWCQGKVLVGGTDMDAPDAELTPTSVIIKSSTPDSVKRFKITVDDTGAIKAEEVV